MIDALRRRFRDQFGRAPSAAARAPGRVNWIGEHTDYNGGLMLPCAIDRATWVAVAPRDDDRFRVVSREQPGACEFAGGDLARRGDWVDYARGAVAALREAGAEVPGADLAIASDVPLGSGLSSSAALLVALVTALDAAFDLRLPAGERARRAHRAETAFVGVPCGIMDSLVSALAREGHLLRIDSRSGETLPVAFPEARLRLLVFHSGTRRRLAAGAYAARRDECFQALAAARAAGIAPASATALCDLDAAALPALERALAPELFRRARHVIRENARVDASCEALRRGDLERAGALLREGMRSLRDDFEVSTPELDLLCELGDAAPGVFGSRLTGAGFGGCTLHAVAREAAGAAALAIAAGFERRTGRRPEWLRVAPGGGAAAVPIA